MGHPIQSDEMPHQAQLSLEPFEKWVMDFVGTINPPNKKSYILVCTDYVTNGWRR